MHWIHLPFFSVAVKGICRETTTISASDACTEESECVGIIIKQHSSVLCRSKHFQTVM